jgi:hypothetical protein
VIGLCCPCPEEFLSNSGKTSRVGKIITRMRARFFIRVMITNLGEFAVSAIE